MLSIYRLTPPQELRPAILEETAAVLSRRPGKEARSRHLQHKADNFEDFKRVVRQSKHAVLVVEEDCRKFSLNLAMTIAQVHSVDCFYCCDAEKQVVASSFNLEAPLMIYFSNGAGRVELKIDTDSYDQICSVLSKDVRLAKVCRRSTIDSTASGSSRAFRRLPLCS